MKKGVQKVPDFSRRTGPKQRGAPPPGAQKPAQQVPTPSNPKPHSTSMKSGRRGS
jgi:hypothetical protein